jgi:glycerol uptake facilitator-like aquaporin
MINNIYKTPKILNSITITIAAIITALLLGEWYNLGIKHNTEDYPFGGEGPTPYYYKSLESYISNTLTWATIFGAILMFSIFTITRKNRRLQYCSFGLLVASIIAMFINGQIRA